MSTVRTAIITIIDQESEVHGVEELIRILREDFSLGYNRTWTREKIYELESVGAIEIINRGGGRGHKNILRKNRNSPGYPRIRA